LNYGPMIVPPYVQVKDGLVPWTAWHIAASDIDQIVAYAGADPSATPYEALEKSRAFIQIVFERFPDYPGQLKAILAEMRVYLRKAIPMERSCFLTRGDGVALEGLVPPWGTFDLELLHEAPIRELQAIATKLEVARQAQVVGLFNVAREKGHKDAL